MVEHVRKTGAAVVQPIPANFVKVMLVSLPVTDFMLL